MFNKFPRRSGIYRINDNVEQLQLRLQLRHISSLVKLPKFDLNQNSVENWRLRHTTANRADEVQEITIKWQEKIMSAHEMKHYREGSNCVTATQERYHAWLLAGGGARVSKDTTPPFDTASEKNAKSKSKKRRRKKDQQHETTTEEDEHVFTYIDVDKHQPVDEEKASHAKDRYDITCNMYIYATLQSRDTLLITLRWSADTCLLYVYPDFNDFQDNPYYLQIEADYCHLYAYGFKNTSQAITADHSLDKISLGHLPITTHWQSEQQLAAEFAMPPKNCRRIVLLLEIREACDFEYDSIHVRYRVRLPDNVIVEEGLLQASTQTSAAKRGTHHFGYCWQLTLLSEECEHFSHDLCHIFFEVFSIDGWQRERVEGFAHCAYALQAASGVADSRRLRCLRPVDDFYDRLNRYFIGGRRHFDLERFFLSEAAVKMSPDDAISFQSRYGYRMQRTGELLVSCRRLTQRNCKLLQPCLSRSSGMTLDDIMLAYREARKRLETIVLQ